MKSALLLSFFLFLSYAGFAQYGKLEPLDINNNAIYVLRTPGETIEKLSHDSLKVNRKTANYIRSVEKQLDYVRNGFLANRVPTMNIPSFISGIKFLESNGIDVNYYLAEYFFYFPKPGQPDNRPNRAY